MPATDIAIVGYAQTPSLRDANPSEVQLLVPTVTAAIEMAGINRREIGFTCAGSCDYLTGGPFAFVSNLEAAGAWPPISESHVEADGAWALYEAWMRLQEGDIDIALAFGSGKSSPSDPAEVWAQQLDPYYLAPLALDPVSLAGLQARALLDSGKATERDFAQVVANSRRSAASNPNAQLKDAWRLGRRPARRAVSPQPAAQARLPPDLGRGGGRRYGPRRPGPVALRAPGLDQGPGPPYRGAPARGARHQVISLDGPRGA